MDTNGILTSVADLVGNEGGTCELYYSTVQGGPYELNNQEAWDPAVSWIDVAGADPGYYVATQTGNGSTWLGVSPYSNEFHV